MLKGTHKQMVVLHTNGSAYYEEAYFVLREDRRREEVSERTMLEEANRILSECCPLPGPRRPRAPALPRGDSARHPAPRYRRCCGGGCP